MKCRSLRAAVENLSFGLLFSHQLRCVLARHVGIITALEVGLLKEYPTYIENSQPNSNLISDKNSR